MDARRKRPAPREARLLSVLTPWIPRGATLLDLGAGTGLLARALGESLGLTPVLVDVIDYNQTDLPFDVYDGKRLPFRDKAFDVTLVAFVLHHADDPLGVLREAARVSRRVVILEDTCRNAFESLMAAWTDWILNREQGVAAAWGRLMPEAWRAMVQQGGLHVLHTEEIPPKYLGGYRDPIRHLLVVAEPPGPS